MNRNPRQITLAAGLACFVWLAFSTAGWPESPLQPGASVSFRIADRSTAVEPSAVGLLIVGSNAERARAAAEAVLRGLTLVGDQGRDLSFTTRIVPGVKDLSGDVRLRIDVIRQSWEPGWYELRLALDEPDVVFVQSTASDPGGAHLLRFRIGSEPLLRAASVCVKGDGRRMIVLDLSEPIAATQPSAALSLAGGTPCPDPSATALDGRAPIPRQRLYRLCPAQGDEVTLRLAAPLTGSREHRWNIPTSSDVDEGGEPCRRLAVE
jgi:hypothetical protein